MPKPDVRRFLPTGLTGLAGVACAACCAIPVLIAAGVLGGVGWAAFGRLLPGIAIALAVAAGGAWWWAARRRHQHGCAGGGGCSCGSATSDSVIATAPVRSQE